MRVEVDIDLGYIIRSINHQASYELIKDIDKCRGDVDFTLNVIQMLSEDLIKSKDCKLDDLQDIITDIGKKYQ